MGSLDRESVSTVVRFVTGSESDSEVVSTARYAWQSIHFPSSLNSATMTYEVFNEASDTWVAAVDFTGVAVPTVAVVADMVLPVDQHVNYSKRWRISLDVAQTAGTEVTIVNKT